MSKTKNLTAAVCLLMSGAICAFAEDAVRPLSYEISPRHSSGKLKTPDAFLPAASNISFNLGREIKFANPLPRLWCGDVECGTYNNVEVALPGLMTTESSAFGKTIWDLRKIVWADRKVIVVGGRALVCPHNWVRDSVHMMKGARHWEYSLQDYLQFFIDTQRADGQFFELVKQLDDPHWTFVRPDCYRLYPEDNVALARLELEADVEYLMVEGCVQAWRVTGDDGWLRGVLPALEKGIDYQTSDPKRWNAGLGLCIRPYTIDTWDITFEQMSLFDRTADLSRPMAAMHGDNTGVYQAMNQLAWINERFGDAGKAARWRERAAALKAAMFRHLWNGRFFCHQFPVNCESLDGFEKERLSLSMAYGLNRGVFSVEEARGIVKEYKSRRDPGKGFAEWCTIDPPYRFPLFRGMREGVYVNGTVSPFTAGELARGAFECGEEAYGWDILERLSKMMERDGGRIAFTYDPKTGAPQWGGPAAWGAAGILAAIDEGLAGIKDLDAKYRRIRFAPRWVVTPFAEGRYLTGYEASRKTVDCRWILTEKGLRYRLVSPAETVEAHIMLPAGKKPSRMLFNGEETPFALSVVGESLYVDATVVPDRGVCDFEIAWQGETK